MSSPTEVSVLVEHKSPVQIFTELKRSAYESARYGTAPEATLGIDINSSFIPWYVESLSRSLSELSGIKTNLRVYFIDGSERSDATFSYPSHIGIGVDGKIELQRIMKRSSHHASERKLDAERLNEIYANFLRTLGSRYPAHLAELGELNEIIAVLVDSAEKRGRERDDRGTAFSMQTEFGREIIGRLTKQHSNVSVTYVENKWIPEKKSAEHGVPHKYERRVFIPAQKDKGEHMNGQIVDGMAQGLLLKESEYEFVMLEKPATDLNVPLSDAVKNLVR